MWWNEQWMGWPLGPEYAASSNVDNAGRLQGQLLLIVGEMDTNVDPASTMQVVNALIKADKVFDLLVIPGAGHGMGGAYGERKMYELLRPQSPRGDAAELERGQVGEKGLDRRPLDDDEGHVVARLGAAGVVADVVDGLPADLGRRKGGVRHDDALETVLGIVLALGVPSVGDAVRVEDDHIAGPEREGPAFVARAGEHAQGRPEASSEAIPASRTSTKGGLWPALT